MNKLIIITSLLLYFLSNNGIAQENLLGKSKEDIVNNVLKDKKYSINKTLGTIVENIEGVGMQVYSFDTLNNCNKILIVPKEFKINGTSVKQFLWSNCNKNYTILGPDKWKTICRGNYVYIYETTDPDYGVSFVWTY
jgi:hypothetical protein